MATPPVSQPTVTSVQPFSGSVRTGITTFIPDQPSGSRVADPINRSVKISPFTKLLIGDRLMEDVVESFGVVFNIPKFIATPLMSYDYSHSSKEAINQLLKKGSFYDLEDKIYDILILCATICESNEKTIKENLQNSLAEDLKLIPMERFLAVVSFCKDALNNNKQEFDDNDYVEISRIIMDIPKMQPQRELIQFDVNTVPRVSESAKKELFEFAQHCYRVVAGKGNALIEQILADSGLTNFFTLPAIARISQIGCTVLSASNEGELFKELFKLVYKNINYQDVFIKCVQNMNSQQSQDLQQQELMGVLFIVNMLFSSCDAYTDDTNERDDLFLAELKTLGLDHGLILADAKLLYEYSKILMNDNQLNIIQLSDIVNIIQRVASNFTTNNVENSEVNNGENSEVKPDVIVIESQKQAVLFPNPDLLDLSENQEILKEITSILSSPYLTIPNKPKILLDKLLEETKHLKIVYNNTELTKRIIRNTLTTAKALFSKKVTNQSENRDRE